MFQSLRKLLLIQLVLFFLVAVCPVPSFAQLPNLSTAARSACEVPVVFATSSIAMDRTSGGPVCISCDEVTLQCDDGNQLSPDCALHLPTDGDGGCIFDYETGDKLSKKELQQLLERLRRLYDDGLTYGEALVVCITAHEVVHGTHSTSSGEGMLACESEDEAFEESVKCFEEALESCSSDSECQQIEEELQRQKDGKLYNQCLCQNHPTQTRFPNGESWPDTCEACKDMQGCVDCHEDWTQSYCTVNDPENPWIIG